MTAREAIRENTKLLHESARKAAEFLGSAPRVLASADMVDELGLPVTSRALARALPLQRELRNIPRGGAAYKASHLWYHARWEHIIKQVRNAEAGTGAA